MAQCEDCREVLKCPKCSVPMVYHRDGGGRLLCHYCGTQIQPRPTVCPLHAEASCKYRGFGTQKAEEEQGGPLPRGPHPADGPGHHRRQGRHEKLLASFARHEYDIMVGTQMVAKGLDF